MRVSGCVLTLLLILLRSTCLFHLCATPPPAVLPLPVRPLHHRQKPLPVSATVADRLGGVLGSPALILLPCIITHFCQVREQGQEEGRGC